MPMTVSEKIQKTYSIVHDSFAGLRLQPLTKLQQALIAAPYAYAILYIGYIVAKGLARGAMEPWLLLGNIFMIAASLGAIAGMHWSRFRETIWPVILMVAVSAFAAARLIAYYISIYIRMSGLENVEWHIFSLFTLIWLPLILFLPLLFLNRRQKLKIIASWAILFAVFLILDLIIFWNPSPETLLFVSALTISLLLFPKITVKLITACVAMVFVAGALIHLRNDSIWRD